MDSHDEALFKKAANGDLDAFSCFIKSYERLIYSTAYRMFPNTQDAQDISQEVLIKIYRSISSCKSAAAFKSWLFKVINNTCIDEIRKRKNKQALSLDAKPDNGIEVSENPALKDTNTPETEYMKKDKIETIQRAIDKLSPEYKMVIILRDINGLTYDEIAEITKLNQGTVKSRIARGRSALRKELTGLMEQN